MKIRYFIIAILTTLSLAPCLAQKHQHGKASYYSKKATGARSASGKKIHHDSLVCAHRYFPFGTKLKVTNMSNGKSVVVKVIDRGPFGRGRIIDISWAAAKAIGMIAQGVATVKVERLDNPIPYRPEDNKLPKIDFEMAESDFKDFPKWRKEKEAKNGKNSKDLKNKEENKSKKEENYIFSTKEDNHFGKKEDAHNKKEDKFGKKEIKHSTQEENHSQKDRNHERQQEHKTGKTESDNNNHKAKNHH